MEVVEISDLINEEKQETVMNPDTVETESEEKTSEENHILTDALVDDQEQENLARKDVAQENDELEKTIRQDDLAQENFAQENLTEDDIIVAEIIITPANSEPERETTSCNEAETVVEAEEFKEIESEDQPEIAAGIVKSEKVDEIEAKVEEIVKVVVDKVTTEAESEETVSEPIAEPAKAEELIIADELIEEGQEIEEDEAAMKEKIDAVEDEEVIIAEKINDKTIERDHDIDSLESDLPDSEDKIVDDVDNSKVTDAAKNDTTNNVELAAEDDKAAAIVAEEIVADSEKFEMVEDNDSIIVEKQDEEIIFASKDLAESAQPQSSEIISETGASACSESFEKVESVLEDHVESNESEMTSTNEQEEIGQIIAEKIPESTSNTAPEICDDIQSGNSSAVVEEPSETYEDSSEATAVALTESENEETIIIAEPIREAEISSETIQFSQSEQDLSQAASDLSEINCFKNPMLASSSIEDDLSSEAVANIILESQQTKGEKLSDEKEDEFCSVDSSAALQESAQFEPGKK